MKLNKIVNIKRIQDLFNKKGIYMKKVTKVLSMAMLIGIFIIPFNSTNRAYAAEDSAIDVIGRLFGFALDNIVEILIEGAKITTYPDGRKEYIYTDGMKVITYPDSELMEVFLEGNKLIFYPDGRLEIIFPDGGKNTTYPDGRVEIIFPDGKKQTTYPDDREETIYPNGSKATVFPSRTRYRK